MLAKGVWAAHLTHNGRSNFIVKAFDEDGRSNLLANVIGPYSGSRMLAGDTTYVFDVDADGSWTLDLKPLDIQLGAAFLFAGTGDAVSGLFYPAGMGPVTFAFVHTGSRNFIVHLYCDRGSVLAQNEIGPVDARRVVAIPKGSVACLWEVQADGDWSITYSN